MNKRCGYGFTLELQVSCCTGIFSDNAVETCIESGTGSRVYAHVAHCATDDQIADILFFQNFQQTGLTEAVGEVLFDNYFIVERNNYLIDFRAVSLRQEKSGVRSAWKYAGYG